MNKLANQKFDITDEILSGDPSLVYRITDGMDEKIKEAAIPSEEQTQSLDRTDVALIIHFPGIGRFNKYAHNTKELTELNSQLLAVKAPTLPDEIVKTAAFFLKRACKRWSIFFPEYLEKYAEERPASNIVNCEEINEIAWAKKLRDHQLMAKEAELAAANEKDFALPLDRKYPIKTAEQIEKASAYFDTWATDMTAADRLTFSRNLNQAAMEKEVEIVGEFHKYANLDLNKFGDEFSINMERRKKTAPQENEKIANSYENLEKRKEEFGPFKTAALLEAIDEGWNAKKHYGKLFEDPLISTLYMKKTAMIEVDGRVVTQEELNKLAEKDLSGIMDKGTAGELVGDEGLAVFKSLPLPIRSALYEEM